MRLVPRCVPRGERRGGQPVREHRETDRDVDDVEDRRFVREVRFLDDQHGEDDRGEPARAEPYLLRSIRIAEAKLGKNHGDTAYPTGLLARVYQQTGQLARAEPLALESMRIQEAVRGKDHPEVAHSAHLTADLYRDMREYNKAELLYKRSLDLSSRGIRR